MKTVLQVLQDKVSCLQDVIKTEKLDKGYSLNEKYIVYFSDRKYLLRIGNINGYEKKKTEFQILNRMRKYNVQSPQPIDRGILSELNLCYMIYTYIDGFDVKDVLHTLTEK